MFVEPVYATSGVVLPAVFPGFVTTKELPFFVSVMLVPTEGLVLM